MKKPTAEIVLDSVSPTGKRLTTFVFTLPKRIQAEFNTHRALSRNAASSRAIPFERMVNEIERDPYRCAPISWGRNRPGMQESDAQADRIQCTQAHIRGYYAAKATATALYEQGVHKQVCNRYLEPYMWTKIVATATEWTTFFVQRCHESAEPHIRAAAIDARRLYYTNEPRKVDFHGWHMPFLEDVDAGLSLENRIKVSVARCARVSYLSHDGTRDVEKDIALYDKLANADPPHASPLEHAARAMVLPSRSGNFIGWQQHRKRKG